MLYYVDKLPNFIDIGEEAENIAVDVSFDLTAWVEMHGPGAAQLLVQRPQDTNPYPAVTTTADDVLTWKPTQTDTAFVGRGKIQLIYSTADEVLEKSPIIYIVAGDSLEGAGDPPEPYEDWIDSLIDLASETLINAQAAANSADAAEDAKDDAVNAKTAAENAQLAAETAQGKAEGFADDAEASAGDAAGYATAAEAAKEAIEDMTVTASVDANVGTPSVDITKTEIGGVVNIDLDFHNLKGADGVSPTNAVTDVQVAGTSVVSDHVANIPYADISTPGVIKVNADYGVAFAETSKFPYINSAVTGGIQPGSSAYRPIVPKYQHESVFYGLSKAAGVDLANETVTVGTYPAVSKAAIKNMLGVPDDAGDIAYDDSETYPADTVGSEISSVKSALNSKAAEPTGTKAAGKVYGLDNSLNPVWLTQSGGGGDDVAPVIVDTASGAIASFPDGLPRPVVGLSVGIEPVQDLHGYSNPWPAGGGKNLLNLATVTDGVRTTNVGGLTTANYAFVSEYIPVSANTDYYCDSVIPSSIGYAFCFYDAEKAFLRYVSKSGGGSAVGNSGADAAFMRVTGLLSTKDTTIIAQSSTAVTFEPYSNICPISGWSEVSVFLEESYDPQATPKATIQLGQTVYGGELDVTAGKLRVTHISTTVPTSVIRSDWFTTDAGRTSIGFYINAANWVDDTSLALPGTSGGIFSYCKTGSVYNNDNWWTAQFMFASGSFNRFEIRIPKNVLADISTAANARQSAKDYLTANPLQMVYQIAEPLEFDLTAAQLETLLGQNNIWATTGDVSVDYRADTKLYINKAIAAAVAAL